MNKPRALLVTERRVLQAERADYITSLRERHARCAGAGVQFWAFEKTLDASSFLEFAESNDASMFEELGLVQPSATLWQSVDVT